MSRDPQQRSEHLPPWLRQVPLPPDPDAFGGAPADTAGMPDWLRSSAESSPQSSGGSALPPWLADVESAPEESPAAAAPAWLSEEPQLPGEPSKRTISPDWLQEFREVDSPRPLPKIEDISLGLAPITDSTSAGEQPLTPFSIDDLTITPGSQASAPSAPAPAEDVPDWLRGASAPTPSAPAPAEDVPDWLRGASASAPSAPAPAEDVPDWLRGASASAPSAPAPSSPAARGAAESEVPSWLSDLAGDSGSVGAYPIDAAQAGVRSEELPDWLRSDPQPAAPVPPAPVPNVPVAPVAPPRESLPDWLRDEAPASGATPPVAGDVPDWLRGDTPPVSPAPPTVQPPVPEEIPSWLGSLSPSAPPAPPAPTPAAEDLPAWLRTDQPPAMSAPQPPSPPAREVQAAGEDLPAWLREEKPATAESGALPDWLSADLPPAPPAPAPAPAAPAGDIPDWLRGDVGTPAAPPPVAPPPAPAPPAGDIPDWLRGDMGTPAAPPPAVAPASAAPAPAAPAGDIPDWLRGDVGTPAAPPPAAPPPAAPAAPAAPAPAADIPDWLRGDVGTPAAPPPAAPPPAAPAAPAAADLPPWLQETPGAATPAGDAGLPDWLRGAESDTGRGAAASGGIGMDWFSESTESTARTGGSDLLGGADLPAWLKPRQERDLTQEPAAPSEARMLEFLNKLAPIEEPGVPVVSTGPRLQLPAAPVRSQAQVEAITLLQQLAAEPLPLSEPAPVLANMNMLQRFGIERVLYLAVLIIMLTALLIPSLSAGFETPVETPDATELAQRLSGLTDKDVVLVGYEWDARRVSELRPLEHAVLGQLIRQRVKLVLVSTDPQGTLLQFDLRDQLREPDYLAGGVDYLLLGYKPGGDAALRALAQDLPGALRSDFQGNDATISMLSGGDITGRPLQSVGNFSAILVLADEPSDVQSWTEQIHTSAPNVPIGFLIPADVAPMMQPYLVQPGIFGLAGKVGALAYEAQTGTPEQAGAVVRETGQFRLALVLFTAIVLVGGVATLLNGLVQRRRKSA